MSFNAVNNTTRGSPDTKALHAREQEEKLRTEAAFHDDGDTYGEFL